MNKKRFMVVATLVVVVALMSVLLTGCGGNAMAGKGIVIGKVDYYPEHFKPVDYSNMEEVEGMDSFVLLNEVYTAWCEDTGYKRDQYFTFVAANAPLHKDDITNFTNDVYKIDGNRLYKRMVVVQNSAPVPKDKYELTRFYFDGEDESVAKKIVVNDKTIVLGGDTAETLFTVSKEVPMQDFTEDENGNVEKHLATYKTHLTTYIWNDKANLANKDYKVYTDENGNLRFTITINCSKEMMDTVHTAARDEFIKSTGAAKGTLVMRENTTIDFVVGEVNGVNKILAWRRTEQYAGDAFGATVEAKQTSVELFSYDEADYKITDADIA